MRAMVLAAGLGTRLRPLTDDRPKALVTIAGRTLLEITLTRLKSFGVHDAIVNVHHYAETMIEYLKANDNFGMRIEISREEILLDTGGGLKQAAHFFLESSGSNEKPFILHNVDVISAIDLGRMVSAHMEKSALATLAVQHRETSRYLLFDKDGELCGRRTGGTTKEEILRPATKLYPLAFCGIHIISPQIFAKMSEEGSFSIISSYMRLIAQGEKVAAFNADNCYWRDLGRPESIEMATQEINEGKYPGV